MKNKWVEYKPYIGSKTVLTYKHAYSTYKPYFGTPNIIYEIRNKIKGINKLIDYLNTAAIIEHQYNNGRPVVSFTPNISSAYTPDKHKNERLWAYEYIVKLVKLVGLEPEKSISQAEPPVVMVALDNPKNLKVIRNLAPHLAFQDDRVLTREIVRRLMRTQKTK